MKIHNNKKAQRILGLLIGIVFGFLLHKGGATKFDVIVGQLRLKDFTVLRIMLSSVIVSMLGISILYPKKLISLEVKSGSLKNALIGGLIFGIGFALLGYCPGTIAGAVGNGYLDGLVGGMTGIMLGSWIFAMMYGKLRKSKILTNDKYSGFSYFEKMGDKPILYTLPIAATLVVILILVGHL